MQTHPPTEHNEIHMTNHVAIKQTLSQMTPSTLFTLPAPKFCYVQPFYITALSMLASAYYFANLSTFCLTMCPLF